MNSSDNSASAENRAAYSRAVSDSGTSPEATLRRTFSRVYVEEDVLRHPRTDAILQKLNGALTIPVRNYKSVFNRPHQAAALQKQVPNLILAALKPPYLYQGAPVCQDFGERHFMYTSCVMNCPYDCEYCYLQGMYPSGDIVIFVNTEDIFAEIENVLKEHPLYLCISFDTDLPALERLTGFLADWTEFALKHPDLLLEIRTKSAALSAISPLPRTENVIFAVTLSPDPIIRRFEHRTPSLSERLRLVKTLLSEDRQVRLCFDPMLRVTEFEAVYGAFFEQVKSEIPADALRDVSIGTFRISADYLKRMRKNRPCEITFYPYTLKEGVYSYDEVAAGRMLAFARSCLDGYLPERKIFSSDMTHTEG